MPRSTSVGPYRILRLINQGGQGTVYLGFDDRLHRRVAVKIVRLPKDKSSRRDLLREAKVVARIQSPKVVQIYDLIVASDHVALIMEYVPGCDLEEFLSNEKPSLASIVAICIDVSGALAAARQQQIVHGDLKASNILITDQGRVKLTDFGIARLESDLPAQPGGAASLSSMSPEQYLGEPLDIRSDLFSLGCLLYRMLTGEHPFVRAGELDSTGLLEGTPQAVQERVPQSMLVPIELSELLGSLLQKCPDDRPGNTHQVRNLLREIARDIPLSVSNTLLREAEVHFRRESEEDIPPVIPADLTRNGRSSLGYSGRGFWSGFLVGQPAWQLIMTVLIVAAILLYSTLSRQVPVTLMAPSLNIATAAELPPEVSSRWLVSEIEVTLAQSTYKVDETELTTYYSPGLSRNLEAGPASERLRIHINLNCVEKLCLLGLVLEAGARRSTEQQLIISTMPIGQWSDLVRSATRDLLAHNK